MRIKIIFVFLFVALNLLFLECNNHEPQKIEQIISKPIKDSLNDAIFDCFINKNRWNSTDSTSGKLLCKSNELILNIRSHYNSVTFEDIILIIPIGKLSKNINQQLKNVIKDTILSQIIYSFAEIDYTADTPMPVSHLAFNLSPSALVCISKIDTVKATISGTFKGFAIDEKNTKYAIHKGKFLNVHYTNRLFIK